MNKLIDFSITLNPKPYIWAMMVSLPTVTMWAKLPYGTEAVCFAGLPLTACNGLYRPTPCCAVPIATAYGWTPEDFE